MCAQQRLHFVAVGEKYGRWTVIREEERGHRSRIYVLCRCDCGVEKLAQTYLLVTGVTKSCGCLRREVSAERVWVHGLKRTKLYGTWGNIKRRCTDENSSDYPVYGGRGISVCSEWRDSFVVFREWSLANGYQEGLEIDRRDNDGNYESENCRWVTRAVNARNKSNNISLTVWGETKLMVEWAEDSRCKIDYKNFSNRVRSLKWNPEMAMTLPVFRQH